MQPAFIEKKPASYPFLFSICAIVTNMNEYEEAKRSFEICGFTENCEYLVADNSSGNQFSAYEAIAGFLKQSSAHYLIIIHQDIRCIDKKETLIECLDNLTDFDKNWALCGNAGSMGYHEERFYLNNGGKEIITKGLPARVKSLDENMLIINRDTNLTLSGDLSGFHFYGLDLCLVADFLGYNCYVIPFMVSHLSMGNLEGLNATQGIFINQYGKKLRGRFIETTCTKLYLSNSVWKNKMFNSFLFFPAIKFWQRLKFVFRRFSPGTKSFKTTKRNVGQY